MFTYHILYVRYLKIKIVFTMTIKYRNETVTLVSRNWVNYTFVFQKLIICVVFVSRLKDFKYDKLTRLKE